MNMTRRLSTSLIALLGMALIASTGRPDTKDPPTKDLATKDTDQKIELPEAVQKTFKEKFPKAEIEKIEVEDENGVTVYDIEFKEGETEKETDITADGTMLEFTIVIGAKDVPAAAMKPIGRAAEGAKMKRIERIEISYETKAGKVVKLPKVVTHYAVEMAKGNQTAEIVVMPDGTVIEAPKWEDAKKQKP